MRWPSNKLRDFVHMGSGIRGRYSRCREWWHPHLQCTKDFIRENISPCEHLLVLGAGSLLDIEVDALLEVCEILHLYDADHTCEEAWARAAGKEYGTRVLGHCVDCTETLEQWSAGLKAGVCRNELSAFLKSCHAPVPEWQGISCQGIISLNLLGQIPLYWRDRVMRIKSNLTHEEMLSLTASMERLQSAHIAGLLKRNSAWSILLTDTEYYFYHSDQSEWRIEPALFGNVPQLVRQMYKGFGASQSWLWHVAPQYVESDDEGEIHRVEAFIRKACVRG